MLAGMLAGLFCLLMLSVSFLGLAAGKAPDLWGIVKVVGFFASFSVAFVGIITFPMGVLLPFTKPRPLRVYAGRGRLMAVYRGKRVQVPLSECRWKPTRITTMDSAGAFLSLQPKLLLSWIPSPSGSGEPVEGMVITVGLTPRGYEQWIELLERERVVRLDQSVLRQVVLRGIGGGILGLIIGCAVATVAIPWGFPKLFAAGLGFMGFIQGAYAGSVLTYAAKGDLLTVHLLIGAKPRQGVLLAGLAFCLAMVKFFRGAGLPLVIPAAIIYGSISAGIWWTTVLTYRKRVDTNTQSAGVPD